MIISGTSTFLVWRKQGYYLNYLYQCEFFYQCIFAVIQNLDLHSAPKATLALSFFLLEEMTKKKKHKLLFNTLAEAAVLPFNKLSKNTTVTYTQQPYHSLTKAVEHKRSKR